MGRRLISARITVPWPPCMRLLGEPQFRTAARCLGDRVAADAEQSTLVRELETVAAESEQLVAG